MTPRSFTLRAGEAYIQLNHLLKVTDVVHSGGGAKRLVEQGDVYVNGVQEFRLRNKLRSGDLVEAAGLSIRVVGADDES